MTARPDSRGSARHCPPTWHRRFGYRALPGGLAKVSPQFRTPAVATIIAGLLLLALGWVYLLTTSVQSAFSYVLNNTGILYATFYCVTAISAVVYYRRRVMSNWKEAVTIGILPSPQ